MIQNPNLIIVICARPLNAKHLVEGRCAQNAVRFLALRHRVEDYSLASNRPDVSFDTGHS